MMVQEAITKLTMPVSTPGAKQSADEMRQLDTATQTVTTASARWQQQQARSAAQMREYNRLMDEQRTQSVALAQQTLAMVRYQQQQTETVRQLSSANDNAANSFRLTGIEAASTANHLKTAAAAAYVLSPAFRQMVNPAIAASLRAIGPAASAAGGAAVSALMPVLAFVSRLALPVWAAVEAWKAMNAITELGAQRIKEFTDLSTSAGAAGVSTEFFQRATIGAKALHVALGDVVKKFNEITSDKLGGSDFEKRLKELSEAATKSTSGATNFVGNSGVEAFKNAVTTEERWRAVTVLITKAMEAGERLAALDLAAKFLPPEMMDRLRANGAFLKEMQDAADKVKPADIFTPEQVGFGISLNARLKEANDTIANRLKPVQKDLTDLGLQYQESWVKIVEIFAGAVSGLTSVYGWVKSIDGVFNNWGNAEWIKTLNRWMDSKGLTSMPEGAVEMSGGKPVGSTADVGAAAMTAARARLAGLLQDTKAVQAAMLETTNTAYKVVNDKSKDPAKTVNETRDAYDRAVASIEKHALSLQADTLSVNQSTAVNAQLKAEFQLLEAAKISDKSVTDDQIAAYTQLRGIMDTNLALLHAEIDLGPKRKTEFDRVTQSIKDQTAANVDARIKFKIDFDTQTMFLSPIDVQIAQQLAEKFKNDIPAALASSEAAAMRTNAALKTLKKTAPPAKSPVPANSNSKKEVNVERRDRLKAA